MHHSFRFISWNQR